MSRAPWYLCLGLVLLLPQTAWSQSAQELNQDRIRGYVQNCLEGTGGSEQTDSSQSRQCTLNYHRQCAETGDSSVTAQKKCWTALGDYWSGEIRRRTERIAAVAPTELKRWTTESAQAEEAYRKKRCHLYRTIKAPWAGPAEAKCITYSLIERAVDLEVLEGSMPN
ncbi:MAG: hypothetical protein AAFY02_08700 [Pseudomonadota bacterium]